MGPSELEFVGKETDAILAQHAVSKDIWLTENLGAFTGRGKHAVSLILEEKEILLFALLQWAAIAVGYYLWVQMIGWIPIEVWESDSALSDIALNIAFTLWVLLCVALVAYPISIFTAAMGAAHFLRRQGLQSTVAACLKIALPNSRRLWTFHAMDAWITVDIILDRLPKRSYGGLGADRAINEALWTACQQLSRRPGFLASAC